MKKSNKSIIYGVGATILGFLALSYFKTGRKIMNLTAEVVGFKIHSVDWTRLVLRFDVQIQNAASSAVTVNELNGAIKKDGKTIGSFSSNNAYVCEGGNKLTTIKGVEVSVSVTKALDVITNAVTKQMQNFTIDGYLVADGNKIPFQFSKAL